MSSVKKILIAMVAVFIAAIVAWSMTSSLIVHAADDEDTTEYSLAQMSEAATKFFSYAMSPENGGNTDSEYDVSLPSKVTFTTAGGMLGFIDPDATKKEAVNFWTSAGSTKNQTEYPYQFLASLGNSAFYEYAKYGYALNQIGIDQTGNPAASNGLRWFVGLIMMVLYIGSAFVNVVFSFALTLLKFANPFRLFAGKTHGVGTGSGILEGIDSIETAAVSYASGADNKAAKAIASGVGGFATKLRELYKTSSSIGTAIVLPIMTAFMIASITLLHGRPVGNKRTVWEKMKPWVLRLVFLAFGVPLMFSCYDIVLTSLSDQVAASNQTGTKMIASTFVDFEVWATDYSLELPSDQYNILIDKDGKVSDSTLSYSRNLAYEINYMTGAFGALPASAENSIIGSNSTSADAMIEDSYVWNNNNTSGKNSTEYKNNISANFGNILSVVGELQKYMNGDMITASSYEGAVVKSRLMGQNQEKVREMFLDGSNWEHYLKPKEGDVDDGTKRLLAAYDATRSSGTTYDKAINIFSNQGSDMYMHTSGNAAFWLRSHRSRTPGSTVSLITRLLGVRTGLSDLSMYNYLNSSFTETSVIVYSPNTSSSAVTRQNHYAVNNVGGNGLTKVLYLVDAMAVMGCVAVLGYVYAFGLIMANFKAMFKVIPNVFLGVAGSIKAIATVVAYTIAMCLEVIITIFLYCLACDIVMAIVAIVERPMLILFKDVAGGDLISVLHPILLIASIILLCIIIKEAIKWRKVIIQGVVEYMTMLVNRFMGASASAPDMESKGGSKLGRVATVGAGLAVAGVASGGFSGLATSPAGEAVSAASDNLGITDAANTAKSTFGVATTEGAASGDTYVNAKGGVTKNAEFGTSSTANAGDTMNTDEYADNQYDNSTGGSAVTEGDDYAGANYSGDDYAGDENVDGYNYDDRMLSETQQAEAYNDSHNDMEERVQAQNQELYANDNKSYSTDASENTMTTKDVTAQEIDAQQKNFTQATDDMVNLFNPDVEVRNQAQANLKQSWKNAQDIHTQANQARQNINNAGAAIATATTVDNTTNENKTVNENKTSNPVKGSSSHSHNGGGSVNERRAKFANAGQNGLATASSGRPNTYTAGQINTRPNQTPVKGASRAPLVTTQNAPQQQPQKPIANNTKKMNNTGLQYGAMAYANTVRNTAPVRSAEQQNNRNTRVATNNAYQSAPRPQTVGNQRANSAAVRTKNAQINKARNITAPVDKRSPMRPTQIPTPTTAATRRSSASLASDNNSGRGGPDVRPKK